MLHVFKLALTVVVAATLVSACAVRSKTEIEVPGVSVKTEPAYSPGYKHCPPGHAKKGWC
jgi:hypothetical protein